MEVKEVTVSAEEFNSMTAKERGCDSFVNVNGERELRSKQVVEETQKTGEKKAVRDKMIEGEDFKCWNCGGLGHISTGCPV